MCVCVYLCVPRGAADARGISAVTADYFSSSDEEDGESDNDSESDSDSDSDGAKQITAQRAPMRAGAPATRAPVGKK